MSIKGLTKVLLLISGLVSLTACSLRDDETTLPEKPINQKPIAVISPAIEQFIFTDDAINFIGDASSDPDANEPLSYQWTFDNTATSLQQSTEANPGDVSFTQTGIYTASLVVTDSLGLSSDPTSVTINVDQQGTNRAPNGVISYTTGTGIPGSKDFSIAMGTDVVFSGADSFDPDGDPMSYNWDFDGMSATNTNGIGPITVSYPFPGSFIVQLTVTDDQENTDQSPAQITVTVNSDLPTFQHLPVLSPDLETVDPTTGAIISATYNLSVEDNVPVNVVTPDGSWTTPMMRYNGLQLPPVIVAKRGTEMIMNAQNNLAESTTIHWHGFRIPGAQDGGPDIVFGPGAPKTYNFSMQQPAAPLWFHPHADGTTATQVYYGLAGAFVLTDDITDTLETNNEIPSGDHDIAMLIQDRSFNAPDANNVRTLIYQPGGMMGTGMLGDRVLVNGVEKPSLQVDTRQYRFRLYNGSNARTYDFALADTTAFMVVGTDGGLLNEPVRTSNIKLAAGERAEIVIDFGDYKVGDSVTLLSRQFDDGNMGGGMGGGTLQNGAPFDVMRFDVTKKVKDDVTLYASLPNAEINQRLADTIDANTVTRPFEMMVLNTGGGMGGPGGMQFAINGKTFDINDLGNNNYIPDEIVSNNAVEIWEISNTTNMAHPFHAHAIQWQILNRNGVDATGIDLGWKDTVLVQPGEIVRFIGRFDPVVNSGLYMYHCHILEHEDNGMMGTFKVVPPPL